ncbi:MAG: PAS domain S-box protein [Candidatus Melainabacteria bacterium]|nr:MAG: PAS domain S-box protein [Candidatus Melainabacteria bacterium]
MFNRLKLSHRILILVAVPMIFELALFARVGQLLDESEMEAKREAHSHAITTQINEILRKLLTSAGGMGAYAVVTENTYLKRSERDSRHFMADFDRLEALVKDDPDLLDRVKSMRKVAMEGVTVLARIKKIVKEDNRLMAFAELKSVSPMLSTLTAQADAITNEQKAIEALSPQIQEAQRAALHQLLMLGAVLNVLLALALALIFNRGFTKRLRILMDNSYRFAIGIPLNPELTGTDELVKLDQVFHKMAHVVEESARKERAVIENSVDVICSLDADEKFTKVNPASLAAWGFEPSELVGKRFSDIVFPEEIDETRKAIKELIRGSEDRQVECRLVKKDGTLIDVLWSMHWSDEESSLFCVAHDVTEQRRIDRLKQEFVAMVSHDLRTPLASIKGTLSMISEGVYEPTSEMGKKRIADAEMNIDRLVNLIGDVLDIEKLEAGQMTIDEDLVNLSEMIKESVEAVRGVAEQNETTIETTIVEDSDVDVLGEKDRLIQVMVNLLSNAIKFSSKGNSVQIAVSTEGTIAQVRVTDHGRGIPANNIDIIFERFKQSQASDGKRGKGTGLGLAICKAIIEAHKGTIGVESKEGEGSTFWFKLPLYQDPEDLRTAAEAQAQGEAVASSEDTSCSEDTTRDEDIALKEEVTNAADSSVLRDEAIFPHSV